MPCKITQCWKCASWKHRITDFWSYGILSLQNQIIPGEKKNPALEMNIYQVSGGWGGCTGLEVIEEGTKEKA